MCVSRYLAHRLVLHDGIFQGNTTGGYLTLGGFSLR